MHNNSVTLVKIPHLHVLLFPLYILFIYNINSLGAMTVSSEVCVVLSIVGP